jgi:predicted GIY-YIG superfamily endonuclease
MFAEQTVLYRLYDENGQLLYVGVTGDPKTRWKEHRTKMPWWPEVTRRRLELYDTGVEARAAEARAICDEGPLYNRTPGRDAQGRPVERPLPSGCPEPPGYAWSPPHAEYWPAWFTWRAVFRDCMLTPEEKAALGRLL